MGQVIAKLFRGDFSGAWESAKQGVRDLAGVDAAQNAWNSLGSLKDAWDDGVQKGAESWAESQKDKKGENANIGPLAAFQGQAPFTPTTAGTGITGAGTKGGKGKGNSKGSGDGVTLTGSGGSGGGKSIVMNVTNNFNGLKGSAREMAETIAKEVNSRLSDSLAVVG